MASDAAPFDLARGSAAFEVDRFEWTAADRLEVVGRWSGVRGRRFVRPTLTLDGAGAHRRVLALLEHKPWAVEDGKPWIAAFPWDGEPGDFDGAELTVAPRLEVLLPPPRLRSRRRAKGRSTQPRKPEVQPDEPSAAAPSDELAAERARTQRLTTELATARRDGAAAVKRATREATLRARASSDLEAAAAERDLARRELGTLRAELDAARAARDAALRECESLRERLDAAERLRDAARRDGDRALAKLEQQAAEIREQLERERAEREVSLRERGTLIAAVNAAVSERDRARLERNDLLSRLEGSLAVQAAVARERDAAASRCDALARERDGALAERDVARRERDGARRDTQVVAARCEAALTERDAAMRERDALRGQMGPPAKSDHDTDELELRDFRRPRPDGR